MTRPKMVTGTCDGMSATFWSVCSPSGPGIPHTSRAYYFIILSTGLVYLGCLNQMWKSNPPDKNVNISFASMSWPFGHNFWSDRGQPLLQILKVKVGYHMLKFSRPEGVTVTNMETLEIGRSSVPLTFW